jgi:hypothetical protein
MPAQTSVTARTLCEINPNIIDKNIKNIYNKTMDIYSIILILIPLLIWFFGNICVMGFYQFMFKYGITISVNIFDIKNQQRKSFENRIGMTLEKENTIIKIISDYTFLFIPNSYLPVEGRILPYFPGILFIDDKKYKIIIKIPITYLIFPISIIICYIIEKQFTDIIKSVAILYLIIILGSLFYYNFKYKSMILEINKFIDGIEL